MEADSGQKITCLKVDGGASANNLLMQFQADISAAAVQRPFTNEATALGAAFLAGLAVGFFSSREELRKLLKIKSVFTPAMDASERNRRLDGWHKAVKAAQISK